MESVTTRCSSRILEVLPAEGHSHSLECPFLRLTTESVPLFHGRSEEWLKRDLGSHHKETCSVAPTPQGPVQRCAATGHVLLTVPALCTLRDRDATGAPEQCGQGVKCLSLEWLPLHLRPTSVAHQKQREGDKCQLQ